VCSLSQVDAKPQIDDARSSARLSNVLMGTGVFFGVISVVLFTVTPGGDIDESAETASRPPRDWSLAPSVSANGAGVTGAIRF